MSDQPLVASGAHGIAGNLGTAVFMGCRLLRRCPNHSKHIHCRREKGERVESRSNCLWHLLWHLSLIPLLGPQGFYVSGAVKSLSGSQSVMTMTYSGLLYTFNDIWTPIKSTVNSVLSSSPDCTRLSFKINYSIKVSTIPYICTKIMYDDTRPHIYSYSLVYPLIDFYLYML